MVDAVKAVEEKVTETGKKVASSIGSNIWGFFKGFVSAPFKMVGGVVKGIYDNTIGNLWAMALTTGGIVAATQVLPDAVDAVPLSINGEKLSHKMGRHAHESGILGLIKDGGLIALAGGAAIGAAKGAVSSTLDNGGTKDTPAGTKIGGTVGSVASAVALGALAFTFVKSNQISFSGSSDNAAKTPSSTPATPATPSAERHS